MNAPLSSVVDVLVVGAGAAGLAAASALARAGRSCLVVEARDRLGGRAHTVALRPDVDVDLGCEWLHSADRNVLAALAESHGRTLDRSLPPWRRRQAQPGFDLATQDDFAQTQMRFFERLAAAGQAAEATGRDEPASAFLELGNRWNGLLGAISTYYSGTELDNISIIDFERYADSEVDWRVVGGYGAFIASMGAELPVRLSCAVTRVDTTGRRLRVETTRGAIDTQALIVTVPTNVLADGAIRFEPSLDDHLAAAAGLPLGLADKLYFALPDAAAFAPETRLIGATDRVATGSYTIRPRGRPLVEGYFGGDYARALERGGLAAFVDAARREIGAAYGHSFADKLEPLIATGWAQDPFARGSYSYAKPGSADARAKLAEPAADGRVLFAGEATSPHFFSTAHGAWEEGVRAARSLIAADRAASAAVHP